MQNALPRLSPLLLMLCLAGCGQTGALFLRAPYVTFPPLVAPPLSTAMLPVVALPGDATLAPTLATQSAPAAATYR